MDAKTLYSTIKALCAKRGVTISQLEKELHFGTGTIGKWGQSSPSIDKVMAVADYFGVTIDELCGTKQKKKEAAFMQGIIQATNKNILNWIPCPSADILRESFSPRCVPEKLEEIYRAEYKGGRLYLNLKDEERGSILELYMGVGSTPCMRQDEDEELLNSLWQMVKDKEQEQKEAVEVYKEIFTEFSDKD